MAKRKSSSFTLTVSQMREKVEHSHRVGMARVRRLYGLVYPRNTLPVRMVVNVMNRLVWRGPVHASVPPPDVIDRLTSQAGLVRLFSKTTGPWQVAVYRRH
jgi:hypothetical protein